MTVLELLVVLMILLMVTAAAVPIVAPAIRNRQMRESGRLVSSYFSVARSRAIETGRPVGVKIERFASATGAQPFAMTLSQVEVPPPYAGDTFDSTCVVAISPAAMGAPVGVHANSTGAEATFNRRFNPSPPTITMAAKWFTATVAGATFNAKLVRVGDQIQFGGQGPVYTIYGPDSTPVADGIIDASGGSIILDIAYQYPSNVVYNPMNLVPPIAGVRFPWDNPVSPPQATTYQVFRQPVRSATAPLQLPEGTVIDLVCSGIGLNGTFMDVTRSFLNSSNMPGMTNDAPPFGDPIVPTDPLIVFSPSGRVEWVSRPLDGQLVHPTDSIYLLLGRRELMFDATKKSQSQDVVDQNLSAVPNPTTIAPPPPEHFWVAVGYLTGLVTVAEVAQNFQDYQPAGGPKPLANVITDALPLARQFARQSQSVGGR